MVRPSAALTIAAFALVLSSAPPVAPSVHVKIVKRWTCGERRNCECCRRSDGTEGMDCQGDPVCSCCD